MATINLEAIRSGRHIPCKAPMGCIVLQQVCIDFRATQIVDCNDLNLRMELTLIEGAENVSSDASKPVNRDSRHVMMPSSKRLISRYVCNIT